MGLGGISHIPTYDPTKVGVFVLQVFECTLYDLSSLQLEVDTKRRLLHKSYCKSRKSVDFLCRDGGYKQYMQYLSKSRITSPQTCKKFIEEPRLPL